MTVTSCSESSQDAAAADSAVFPSASKAPFTLEINFKINFEIICSFSKEISSVNSQLLKEINFKILFQNLEHVLFCKISQTKFHL